MKGEECEWRSWRFNWGITCSAAPAACFRWRTNLRTLMEWNVGNFNRQNF
jgi:hypothetical protein